MGAILKLFARPPREGAVLRARRVLSEIRPPPLKVGAPPHTLRIKVSQSSPHDLATLSAGPLEVAENDGVIAVAVGGRPRRRGTSLSQEDTFYYYAHLPISLTSLPPPREASPMHVGY